MYISTVKESIVDILLTPIGSRVCLPLYGSKIYKLVDKKVDDVFKATLTGYVFEAINTWEHRVRLEKISDISYRGGKLSFVLHLEDGDRVEMNIKNDRY